MRKYFKVAISALALNALFFSEASASINKVDDSIEVLSLDVISYQAFMNGDPETLSVLERALHENGIVGVRGVPGYKEKVLQFIKAAQEFSSLPDAVKNTYAPDRNSGEMFLGFEIGKEKFKRPDGTWVVDDLKVSYYGLVPDSPLNKWPEEVDLKTSFEDLGMLMSQTGMVVMGKIGLIGPSSGILIDDVPRTGRMLHYRKSIDGSHDNPFWCGAHFDHSIFTALIPAFYFVDGHPIAEPLEAGLFVKTTRDGIFKKVVADDPDVMLFQVGEFGQLVTNDAIRATEHRVHKASGIVERYTLALFFDAPLDTVIHSSSELTQDARYGGGPGMPCSYLHWKEESFKRYLVKEGETEEK